MPPCFSVPEFRPCVEDMSPELVIGLSLLVPTLVIGAQT